MSPEEALAYIMECNMSVDTYNKTPEIALKHGHSLFPSYKKVLAAKKETYPSIMDVTENECSTPLQSLLDKTSSRLLTVINKNTEEHVVYNFIIKWGMDGSLQSTYKQAFGSDHGYDDDESLLCISLVPLQLKKVESNEVLWKNPKPSSSRLCRPIKLLWKKETVDTLKEQEKIITEQISRLNDYVSNNVIIKNKLQMTMVDGKVNFINLYLYNIYLYLKLIICNTF